MPDLSAMKIMLESDQVHVEWLMFVSNQRQLIGYGSTVLLWVLFEQMLKQVGKFVLL